MYVGHPRAGKMLTVGLPQRSAFPFPAGAHTDPVFQLTSRSGSELTFQNAVRRAEIP